MKLSHHRPFVLMIGFTIFGSVLAEPRPVKGDDLSTLSETKEKREISVEAEMGERLRRSDDFFLKASKSVPRIGRGRRGDDFFIKASKNVPRVGRRNTEFLKASKAIPRIGKKNSDPFLIGVKSVPRIGRSGETDEQSPVHKREDTFLAVNDGGLWGVWPWFRNQDFPGIAPSKRSSYILSSYNDSPLRDKQTAWSPVDTIAQEVELGPPIYLEEQV
ncbi:unnamed protein product [Bemisia tabaci]|uniref:Uncharacterized protein n=1 Tax=Bemisia tabaci TaxID=7038 RepID=A0A9P0AE24_BEMTA|nr:unnamed protein product [Bemisia tabaci]